MVSLVKYFRFGLISFGSFEGSIRVGLSLVEKEKVSLRKFASFRIEGFLIDGDLEA